jgi:hypothetical protein
METAKVTSNVKQQEYFDTLRLLEYEAQYLWDSVREYCVKAINVPPLQLKTKEPTNER